MKQLFTVVLLIVMINAFGQSEIMDSIEYVRSKKIPEMGKSFCTDGFWNADIDGGVSVFKQICKWGKNIIQLKISNEQQKGNRAVLTVDFYKDNVLRDRVYLYLDKSSGKWLMDGFNESEQLVKHFLDGFYTGHFTPLDLPEDAKLKELGKKIVSFGQNELELKTFLQQNLISDSDFDFVGQMVDENFEAHTFEKAGYDKRLNKGYIYLKGKSTQYEDYYSNITIFVTKTGNGKVKIVGQIYSFPDSESFL